jgi:C4-dicarboxylate-specific signal transduction histidine kinase
MDGDQIIDLHQQTDLGQVVSALVHDASQPLTAISAYVAACRHLVERGEHEQIEGALKQIAEQTARAWQIIQKIREVAK